MYDAILPYNYDFLEPTIDIQTTYTHYNGHHKKYSENLTKLVNNILLEDIPKQIDTFPLKDRGSILYNAGGVLNHNLYWKSLSNEFIKPEGRLLKKINETYGSFDNFKNIFMSKSKNLVGSGYTFLVTDESGNLTIMNLPNQETPLSYNLIPLFAVDLWEHAYYLKYKNNRNSYIENIWDIADFNNASNIYNKLM